jgi:hypothetical protein
VDCLPRDSFSLSHGLFSVRQHDFASAPKLRKTLPVPRVSDRGSPRCRLVMNVPGFSLTFPQVPTSAPPVDRSSSSSSTATVSAHQAARGPRAKRHHPYYASSHQPRSPRPPHTNHNQHGKETAAQLYMALATSAGLTFFGISRVYFSTPAGALNLPPNAKPSPAAAKQPRSQGRVRHASQWLEEEQQAGTYQ